MEKTAASKIRRPFFILNPVAGTSDVENIRRMFEKACARFDWQPQVHITRIGEDMDQIISAAIEKGSDVIMVGGGDGTVSEVASALVGKSLPLAIIPTGTGNLLARQLLLPLQLEKIFLYIVDQPDSVFLDAMQIGERYYVLNASVGFSSALIENTSRENKKRFGFLAYIWTGAQSLIGLHPHRFKLVVDGNHHSMRASEVFISDTNLLKEEVFFKDLKMWADDGPMGIFVVKARTVRDYLLLLFDILLGKGRHSHKMSYYPVQKQVKISTNKPEFVQADGETIGKTPVTIEIIPQAVQVLVPNEKYKLKPLIPIAKI